MNPKSSPTDEPGDNAELIVRQLDRAEVVAHLEAFLAVADDVIGEYWDESHFLAERDQKWELSFAAWKNVTPVGYAIISERAPGHAHLHHFMVKAQMRGFGVGQMLAESMISLVSAKGYQKLTLKVESNNHGARQFYRRLGFTEMHVEESRLWYVLMMKEPEVGC